MKTSIDLGLVLLGRRVIRGVPLDYRDIAPWCGCSWQRIHQLEQRALRKLRHRERGLEDFMEAYKR